ncbi:hypothetical protein DASB73_014550 [Starmerella bacillaris]|uniref:Uncharacterized protein n=1 Tax=Starmerella bacillaris TaxID=1247836 RepID=A0AAV5RHL9_STABA|nr:hypothetical protein DASB73_014550 [Starmerella bacillaris]
MNPIETLDRVRDSPTILNLALLRLHTRESIDEVHRVQDEHNELQTRLVALKMRKQELAHKKIQQEKQKSQLEAELSESLDTLKQMASNCDLIESHDQINMDNVKQVRESRRQKALQVAKLRLEVDELRTKEQKISKYLCEPPSRITLALEDGISGISRVRSRLDEAKTDLVYGGRKAADREDRSERSERSEKSDKSERSDRRSRDDQRRSGKRFRRY